MKFLTFFILALLALLLVSVAPLAAQNDMAEGFPRTVVDSVGNEITLEAPPERVVVIYNYSYGVLATLGVAPVGHLINSEMVADDRYFEDGESIPSVQGADGLDPELVAALEPDIIIGGDPELAETLSDIAPVYQPGFSFSTENFIEGMYVDVRAVAEIFGLEDRAEEEINKFEDLVAVYTSLIGGNPPATIIAGIRSPNQVNLRVGPHVRCQALNLISTCEWDSPTGSNTIEGTMETLLELDPDVIIVGTWNPVDGYDALFAELEDNALWNELSAVQNDRVIFIPYYTNPTPHSLPGTRIMFEEFAPRLYPDLFPNGPLTDEQVQEILAEADMETSDSMSGEGFPLTIADSSGRELTFEAPPQRVVAIYNDTYGQMASLGIRPVATLINQEMVEDSIYFFDDGGSIPFVTNADGEIDPELVASFEPDLILGWSLEQAATMEGIAPFFDFSGIGGLEDYKENLRVLGQILDAEEAAETAITDFENRLAAYQQVVDGSPTVLKIGAVDENTFWVSTVQDPACLLLDEVATCEWGNPGGGTDNYQTSQEGLLAIDPDIVLLGNWSDVPNDEFFDALDGSPLWNELSAVQNDRVVNIEGYQNPNVNSIASAVKLLDMVVPRLYPDLFPDGPLTDEQVQEILVESDS